MTKLNKRTYHLYNGSRSFFDNELYDIYKKCDYKTFSQLVKESDECRTNGKSFNSFAHILVISNESFNGITEQAHDRLNELIIDLTKSDATIYIHNPPTNLKRYLYLLNAEDKIEISEMTQDYKINVTEDEFIKNMKAISKEIVGQSHAIIEISKTMWYLTKSHRENPYVIMLYGNSSLGKTQIVREIASKFYNNNFFEKHLSMFKNNSYADYFFGEKPNRATLGYELLERDSNLIFLDELDKCPEYFYSAFYTLFDNTIFKDKTYEVNVSKTLIILTSNYLSEENIKKEIGLPVYYRIDKFIKFNDFDSKTVLEVIKKEIKSREQEYSDVLTYDEIYDVVSHKVLSKGENARTIKYKVQKVIEDLLFQKIQDEFVK